YKPYNEESFAILWAMLATIRASHLNMFDPALSIQHKFDGKLRRQKKHTQDFTSLALFRDDVECLLRDLYGDFESEALDSVVLAVFRIVQQFAHYVRPELWKEHDDAEEFDPRRRFCQRGQSIKLPTGKTIDDVEILAVNQTVVSEAIEKSASHGGSQHGCR